jgi:predicted  nucleic acid-binding Zn-ribbon protein
VSPFVFLVFFLSLECSPGFAQTAKPEAPKPVAEDSIREEATLITLGNIMESVQILTEQRRAKEKELKEAATEDQKVRIINEINEIDNRLSSLDKNFDEIATGTDLEAFSARPKTIFNWSEEMQDLLGPIVQELRNMTARPREIEKLRGEVDYYQKRIPIVKTALSNIEKRLAGVKDPMLKKELEDLEKEWKGREQQISNQLSVAQYQLSERLKEKESFWQSTQDVVLVFFRSRGRNLFFAVLAFVSVFLLFRLFYRYVYKSGLIHKSLKHSFYLRLATVIYHILTFIGAIGASLLVFYVAGDWVLLGISLLFLFGLAWTAKQAFPRFYDQGKLLLNLSTVKEGERVVYRGLPWKVEVLSFDTLLVNPELQGGVLHLPLKDLEDLRSRPYDSAEPWFPCKEGDWVILSDGTRGKVISQTPEMVQLVLLGGSRKTYPTKEFLEMNPNNISTNFRLNITFGIDYRHQSISTQEVPQKLAKSLMEELDKEGYGKDLVNLKVEFKEAGASSLDYAIIADFHGRAAKNHDTLARCIQRISVDACNRYGWEIPFTQIMVHNANVSREEKSE